MSRAIFSGGQKSLHCFGRQPLVVDAIEAIGVDMTLEDLNVVNGVREHHHAARREHHIVVELLRQPFPQLERMIVDRGAFVPQIIGADDRRVAPGIAAAEPAFLQHRDIGDAVFLGEIIGGREPVPAGADDHDVIGGLRLGIAPLRGPMRVARRRLAQKIEQRVFHVLQCFSSTRGSQVESAGMNISSSRHSTNTG